MVAYRNQMVIKPFFDQRDSLHQWWHGRVEGHRMPIEASQHLLREEGPVFFSTLDT
jgi:hypothetical protein